MRPHEIERDRILVALELADLELPDAVLGADAAAMRGDEVVHRAADASARARGSLPPSPPAGCAEVEVQVAVAEVAVGDERARRGERARAGARPASMKAGSARRLDRDVVLEARALCACASGMVSRRRQSACALRSGAAMTASRTRPRSIAAASAASKRGIERLVAGRERGLARARTRRCGAPNGSRAAGDVPAANSSAMRGRSSKVVTASPLRFAQRAEQRERGGAARRARRKRWRPRAGRGNSRSVAAVMMPSVPSAPMNSCLGRSPCCPCAAPQAGPARGRRPARLRGPSTSARVCRSAARAVPPALVERLPPIVAAALGPERQSEAAGSTAAAAAAASASTQPASAVRRR